MATTGELRAIIEELQLIDVGDAVNYLGEESSNTEGVTLVANLPQEGLTHSPSDSTASTCED